VLTKSSAVDVEDLPREVRGAPPLASGSGRALTFEIGTPLSDIELRVIHETLRHTKGDKRLAAQLLGIATRTIYRKLEEPNDPEGSLAGDNLAMEPVSIATK
jgi:two-component system response regulator HydG